jgi:hypothetical protein
MSLWTSIHLTTDALSNQRNAKKKLVRSCGGWVQNKVCLLVKRVAQVGSTGYQPVLSGNLPDSSWVFQEAVGRLPTDTDKLPVLPFLKTRPNNAAGKQ